MSLFRGSWAAVCAFRSQYTARMPERSGPVDLLAALRRHLHEVAPHGPRPLHSIAVSLRVPVAEVLRGLRELEEAGEARRVFGETGSAIGWELC